MHSVGFTSGNYVLRINNGGPFDLIERYFRSLCGDGVGGLMVFDFLYCGRPIFWTLSVQKKHV